MAILTNREKVQRGLGHLLSGIEPWVDMRMKADTPQGVDWVELKSAADTRKFGQNKQYSRDDIRFLLRMIVENREVFKDDLSHAQRALVSELKETANAVAHANSVSSDDTYRVLDTAERLLHAIGSIEDAAAVGDLKVSHQREVFDQQARNTLRQRTSATSVTGNVAGTAIKPWRDVVTPHKDVLSGRFSSAEFAADLHAVATGSIKDAPEYTDPVQFFTRTFLTAGLSDLLRRALQRLGGTTGSPVVNLQTQFGGGKTHSMLALYHLFSGTPSSSLPQGVQDLVRETLGGPAASDIDPLETLDVRRVALVGTWLSTAEPNTRDGRPGIRTLWGELAWQLGGDDATDRLAAYERVAEADRLGVPPGEALTSLVQDLTAGGRKILVLVDEWVAYARLLVNRDDLPAGTFEAQFTFAQYLTELARTTPGMMLVVSIPASDTLNNGGGGSALEVGGPHGMAALERLQQVIGRTADDWRPANNVESFEIVRRRLFEEPDAAALADIAAIAKQYVKFYRENHGMFPAETERPEYEARIKAAYPVHPELFDRLYEDWSTLPKFQRTRGVLQLMSRVIHALWTGQDASPMISPGSVPIGISEVTSEVTKYLDDSWKTVVDTDVDGDTSTPVGIDAARPAFGGRAVTRRVARTVFIGSLGTVGTAHRGVDRMHVCLGTAVPGDTLNHIGDARDMLSQRATYFYEEGGRYWFDRSASVSRLATERAAGWSDADVHAEITEQLRAEAGTKGVFAGVHVAVEDAGAVPDDGDLRLAVLHPRFTWSKENSSSARELAGQILTRSGSSQRRRRNMIVMVAADDSRMPDLDGVVREYLAWRSIADDAENLALTIPQANQARTRVNQLKNAVVVRLRNTYTAALVPDQQANGRPENMFLRIGEGDSPLAVRVAEKLASQGRLVSQLGLEVLHMRLIGPLANAWGTGHVRMGDLWSWYTEYPYLQRLTSRSVLESAVLAVASSMIWETEGFALAAGYDDDAGRYVDLWLPGDRPEPMSVPDTWLLVVPERAKAQRAAERPAAPEPGNDESGKVTDATPDGGTTPSVPERRPNEPAGTSDAIRRRFFGSKTLDRVAYVKDWNALDQEVISALMATEGTEVTIEIEIHASNAGGFPERIIRNVRENATTLGFDQHGFEAE
ncbi:Swt1 family HEPN domain-containing protein [Myceligenerans crystallogenes]|uniref:Swt1 family HEPN domain-containing protein n=1 Tax=Myceligenerans crystallogenes TaxID=316335 RepID=A0ABP5A360_9MICO